MLALYTLLVLTPQADGASGSPAEAAPKSYRMIDVNGDGQLDRLEVGGEGALSISINRGDRQFERIAQELPQVTVNDVLAEDLNGDGHTDLYLVARGANAALLGDGSGAFVSDAGELGLTDLAVGLRAERVDVDGDGILDLLLHNRGGDVVFWGSGAHTFERDPAAALSSAEEPGVLLTSGLLAVPVASDPAEIGSGARRADASRAGGGGGSLVSVAAPSASPGGTVDAGGGLDPRIEDFVQIPFPPCAPGVRDVTSGTCLSADSVPSFGNLYPLGMEFNIAPTGEIGMGTTSPEADVHVANSLVSQLRISSNTSTINLGGAEIFLSEALGINCGWRIALDGTSSANALQFISECETPQTRMAIQRNFGNVLIGGDDFSPTIAGPGLFMVNGDVSQSLDSGGMVKAAAHVTGTGVVSRSFNNLPGTGAVSASRLGVGIYEVDFGAAVTGRFYLGTIGTATAGNAPNGTIEVSPRSGNSNAIFIEIDNPSGVSLDSSFFVTIL